MGLRHLVLHDQIGHVYTCTSIYIQMYIYVYINILSDHFYHVYVCACIYVHVYTENYMTLLVVYTHAYSPFCHVW